MNLAARDRLVPDGVLPGFVIEMALIVDVNIEFKSNDVIKARKDHAVRYCSSPDFGAFDYLESFEHLIEHIHAHTFRGR